MTEKTQILPPEWSVPVDIEQVGDTAYTLTITASADECKDIARRLHVPKVESLSAELTLERERGGSVFHVTGTMKALVTQPCVTTMEPVQDSIQDRVEGWYAEPDTVISLAKARHERDSRVADSETHILDEREDPEPISEGQIDLGELVTQHLSLVVNPYPHKEGVEFVGEEGDIEPPKRENPFGALKDWKSRLTEKE